LISPLITPLDRLDVHEGGQALALENWHFLAAAKLADSEERIERE
jgi:hypothetical protein